MPTVKTYLRCNRCGKVTSVIHSSEKPLSNYIMCCHCSGNIVGEHMQIVSEGDMKNKNNNEKSD